MKKVLSAMLTALMLLTILPLASPPAQACTGFTWSWSIFPNEAYVGEEMKIWVVWQDGTGPFTY